MRLGSTMMFAALCAWAVPVRAYGPVFLLQFGSYGTGPGQFLHTSCLTVTAFGEVYLADGRNNRVQRFSSTGTFLSQWGLPAGPYGVAVAPDGTVYTSGEGDRVRHFDAMGSLLGAWGATGSGESEFRLPVDVTVDAAGFVYVADSGNFRIQKFTAVGEFVTAWETQGSGGQLLYPTAVQAEPGGTILVAHVYIGRMQRFDANGTFLSAWGTVGPDPGQWSGPGKPCIDRNGFVVVPDPGNHRIQVYEADGTFVLQWGSFGMDPGQFNQPSAVGVDGEGNLYVLDRENFRIQKFTSATTGVRSVSWSDVKSRFRSVFSLTRPASSR